MNSVCAVIVSHHPDPTALRKLVETVARQVGAVVLVDNDSESGWQAEVAGDLSQRGGALLRQSENVGLAAAQNRGIDWARAKGCSQVLLLDQDSEPGAGMVKCLWQSLQTLSASEKVAAVGPRFHDLREHRDAPFVHIGFPLNRKIYCENENQTIACDFLISSGMLIPLEVLDQIGGMDEGLFIDNVDLEWSFRARGHGFSLHGICSATMHHRLGDARHRLPFGSGQVVVHGSTRLYYMMRNRVRLYRFAYTPKTWTFQDLPRLLVKLLLFGLLIGPRRRNLRFMLRGLRDGLCGREGACPIDTGT